MIQIPTTIKSNVQQPQFGSLTGNGSTYQFALLDLRTLLSKDILILG